MVKDDTQKSKNNIVHGTEGVELRRESSRPRHLVDVATRLNPPFAEVLIRRVIEQ